MNRLRQILQILPILLSCYLALTGVTDVFASQADPSASQPDVQPAQLSPPQLQQLVAPIALYPGSLVAQILAAATYPDQVVEADRWLQEHSDLKGEQLAQEVDKQPWDRSVKALTEFPSVLANMDKNLSWTSSLGDAYINQQQDVMNAVQVMRQRANKAGNLKTTSQEKVTQQGKTIVIEPADPDVIYVPVYDPWVVYGAPIVAWPGWHWYHPGLFVPGPGIAFGVGFGIGFFGGFGWGWHHWGYDWNHANIIYNHNTYISHSRTFINRSYYASRARGNFSHAGGFNGGRTLQSRGPSMGQAFHGAAPQRGFSAPQSQGGDRLGAFGGFNHGGVVRGHSSRGRSSFGGGVHGGFGGGGFHGGGGSHGGGGRR
jgi:hypothetical protein